MRAAIALGLAVASLLAVPAAHATSCMTIHPEVTLLTPPRTMLDRDGGIVVANVSGFAHQADPRTTWTFGARPLVVTNIAPGLDVFAVASPGTLVDDQQKARVVVTLARRAQPRLAAPAPLAFELQQTGEIFDHHWTVQAFAKLVVPATATALVVYDESGKFALTWGAVAPATPITATSTVVVHQGGSCSDKPSGMTHPMAGSKVRLAWLDRSGRLSPQSKPIVVKRVL